MNMIWYLLHVRYFLMFHQILTTDLEINVTIPILQIWRLRKVKYLPKDLTQIWLLP